MTSGSTAAISLKAGRGRIGALDSLRGLAALSVVLSHAFAAYLTVDLVSKQGTLDELLVRTPLALPIAGHEAVMLFFVLSGFVLALPFLSDHPPDYRSFAIRRICRIYLPYMAVLVVGLLARSVVPVSQLPETAGNVAAYWLVKQDFSTIAGYALMTGFQHHMDVDPVVWSLIHEMRISLIFPGLFWVVTRLPGRWSGLSLFLAFSVVCTLSVSALRQPDLRFFMQSILDSAGYVWFFVLGIELARHREALTSFLRRHPRAAYPILALSLGLYCIRYEVPALIAHPAADFIIGVGAAGFIWLVLGVPALQRMLRFPPIPLLGRCSYSLYLLHLIVMLAMIHGLGGAVSPWIVLVIYPFAAVGGAVLLWRYVEVPSQELGRRLARRPTPAAIGAVS